MVKGLGLGRKELGTSPCGWANALYSPVVVFGGSKKTTGIDRNTMLDTKTLANAQGLYLSDWRQDIKNRARFANYPLRIFHKS